MTIQSLLKITRGLTFSLLLIGCAVSINPIVPESEATFDPKLLGNWEEIRGQDRAVISRSGPNTYAIEYTKGGKTGKFEARVGRLREHVILDVWPVPRKGDIPDSYKDILLPAHLFLILDVSPDEVALAALDPDSLLSALRSGQIRLPYKHSKDELTLTGTTEELRETLGPYLDRFGAFPKREKWRRA